MSWKNIRLIFLREVRDQLRDRRTLFMVAILPMLLYPALGIGMIQMTMTRNEQEGNVVILGTAELVPDNGSIPTLISGKQFLPTLFSDPGSAKKLHVTTDEPPAESERNVVDEKRLLAAQSQIETINRLADLVRQRRNLETVLTAYRLAAASGLEVVPADPASSNPDDTVNESPATPLDGESNSTIDPTALQQEVHRLLDEEDVIKAGLTEWFLQSDIQVLVVIPEGFAESILSQTRHLIDREQLLPESFPHPIVLQNSANEKSQIAYGRVREAIDNWEHRILQGQLSAAGLPASIDKPVDPTRVDLAQEEQIAANFYSMFFPTLLVVDGSYRRVLSRDRSWVPAKRNVARWRPC